MPLWKASAGHQLESVQVKCNPHEQSHLPCCFRFSSITPFPSGPAASSNGGEKIGFIAMVVRGYGWALEDAVGYESRRSRRVGRGALVGRWC